MNKYYYCVNTFDKDMNSIQLMDCIEAESKEDAIQKLIDNDTIDSRAYEFLELRKCVNGCNSEFEF